MLFKNLKLDVLTKFSNFNNIENLKIEKSILHFSNNDIVLNDNLIYPLIDHSMRITGQLPKLILAKKSFSAFNVKKNNIVGLIVTLRKNNLKNFLKKTITTINPICKKDINLKFNNNSNILVYNIGFDKLKLIPDLLMLNSINNKEGFHLEIYIKSSNKDVNFYILSVLLSNSIQ